MANLNQMRRGEMDHYIHEVTERERRNWNSKGKRDTPPDARHGLRDMV